ncbi:hypothetical protein F5Y05DRAFT_337903 [Hypoxylon sp. FL0543]|nr:hypothetical protein F5Y05DRAFT_337903 [Hypoxylon sp. FL0543]
MHNLLRNNLRLWTSRVLSCLRLSCLSVKSVCRYLNYLRNDRSRWSICNLSCKPFNKESMLKGHGYYCRSRTAVRSAWPRACMSCARGEAGCDNRRPECSRCKAMGTVPTNAADTRTVDKLPDAGNETMIPSDARSCCPVQTSQTLEAAFLGRAFPILGS